jgi:hypothetical protein
LNKLWIKPVMSDEIKLEIDVLCDK